MLLSTGRLRSSILLTSFIKIGAKYFVSNRLKFYLNLLQQFWRRPSSNPVYSSNSLGLFFTSILFSKGWRTEPKTNIVKSEYNNVSINIIGPIARDYEACKARAYAIAPLSPANHMTNWVFLFNFDLDDLLRFTR